MATMNEKDYYEILGVSKDATSRDIQKAFQQRPASSIRTSTKSRMPRKSLKRFPRPTPCFRMSKNVRATTPCVLAIPLPVLLQLRLMVAATPAAQAMPIL